MPGAPIDEPDHGNLHGLPRSTCRLSGECDVGCNYGSKNTLDHTYLSAAHHHGADLRTRCEVRGWFITDARPGRTWGKPLTSVHGPRPLAGLAGPAPPPHRRTGPTGPPRTHPAPGRLRKPDVSSFALAETIAVPNRSFSLATSALSMLSP